MDNCRVKKLKKLFYRLSLEAGAIFTALAILGAIATGIALYAYGKKTMKDVKKTQHEMNKLESEEKQVEAMVKFRKKMVGWTFEGYKEVAKSTASQWDSTSITGLLDYTVDFNKKEQGVGAAAGVLAGLDNKAMQDMLRQENLPDDNLTIDIAKSILNVVHENISDQENMDVLKEELFNTLRSLTIIDIDKPDINRTSNDVKDSIREDLDKKAMLADQRVIELRQQLNKALNYKKYIQEKIAYYENLEQQGFGITNTAEFNNLKQVIQDIDNKIGSIETDLEKYEDTSTENQIEDSIEEDTGQTEEEAEEEDTQDDEVTETEDAESTEETDDGTTEEIAGPIVLNGTIAGGKGNISMTIDPASGNISGTFKYWDTVQATQDEDTVTCNAEITASISGSMNLETGNISASVSGTVHYSGQSAVCNSSDQPFHDTLTGKLAESKNSASGTCSHGESWYLYK